MGQVLRITLADLQAAEDARTYGPLESRLLEVAAAVKRRERRTPVYVRLDFPKHGGLELRCRRGWLWPVLRSVRLWEE